MHRAYIPSNHIEAEWLKYPAKPRERLGETKKRVGLSHFAIQHLDLRSVGTRESTYRYLASILSEARFTDPIVEKDMQRLIQLIYAIPAIDDMITPWTNSQSTNLQII
ncbi:hypothetical protein TWF569_009127 [Orbilia oligospora]|uniref:Uncharacterized protein n=1 Tax=Orbilia oligospora TaxID=2813651 RepID=A0A7C8NDM3_ORBOL|nr:hypothetical protein TWF103_010447 [Orbilia oligospora]KAF3097726.1 hypothetical protein TWF102_006244 [Orbilia oligospora]KAF3102183.1 hypothetical protein TWF706_005338 [Orbilia oligospora]KAF3122326.1 hypothetical protein TWF594_002853 [Orbilia oligospora]KAF3137679.1 hypothetical protein TWF569_009127 [Orbilia oligospora]